jgi:predicted  nucleic acid-binding Zn-ribbon protein
MDVPENWMGNALSAVTLVAGAILYARKKLSSDKVALAGDAADVGSIARLQAQLDRAEAGRVLAEKRADDFADQRNKLVEQMGDLKGQLATLTEQVKGLTDEVARLRVTQRAAP